MKLATYQDGSLDGQLVVVSRDLKLAHYATSICNTMRELLDDWNFFSPQLQDLYDALNQGTTLHHAFAFETTRCMAPLPRIYQWAQLQDGELRQLRGADGLSCQASLLLEESAANLAYLTADLPPVALPDRIREGLRLAVACIEAPEKSAGIVFGPLAVTLDELTSQAKRA